MQIDSLAIGSPLWPVLADIFYDSVRKNNYNLCW